MLIIGWRGTLSLWFLWSAAVTSGLQFSCLGCLVEDHLCLRSSSGFLDAFLGSFGWITSDRHHWLVVGSVSCGMLLFHDPITVASPLLAFRQDYNFWYVAFCQCSHSDWPTCYWLSSVSCEWDRWDPSVSFQIPYCIMYSPCMHYVLVITRARGMLSIYKHEARGCSPRAEWLINATTSECMCHN